MSLHKRFWGELTTADLAGGAAAQTIAVLPVAAIEQHGPHLPLATDLIIAEGLVQHTASLLPAALPALFLPVQAVGKSDEHIAFPGTLTLSWETAIRAWTEIGESVARAGVKKLVIVTSHGGNTAIIDIVARELRRHCGLFCVTTSFARMGTPDGLFAADELAFGIHGGALETSLLLALAPQLVRMEQAAAFASAQAEFAAQFARLRAYGPAQFAWTAGDLNRQGVVGDARAASAEKGAAVLDHQAQGFIALLGDVQRFDLARLAAGPG